MAPQPDPMVQLLAGMPSPAAFERDPAAALRQAVDAIAATYTRHAVRTSRMIEEGLLAERPDAEGARRLYWASDAVGAYVDTLAGWKALGAGIALRAVDYGADPTGSNDSTAAIQAAIDDLPAYGGTVLLPPGTLVLTDTLRFGDGTLTAASTRRCPRLIGCGSKSEDSGAGTTLVWEGASGGTALRVMGLLQGLVLEDFEINCRGVAATALELWSIQQSRISRVSWSDNIGLGMIFDGLQHTSRVQWNATGGNVFSGLYGHAATTSPTFDAACGMQIGYSGSVAISSYYMDPCQNSFHNCRMRYNNGADGRHAVVAGFMDNNSLVGCLLLGKKYDILIKPCKGSGGYPGGNYLAHMMPNSTLGVDETNEAYTGRFGVFVDYELGDGGTRVDPWLAHGLDTDRKWFGGLKGVPAQWVDQTASTAIANTASATFFDTTWVLPGRVADSAGWRVRVKATGKHSTSGTPTAKIELVLGRAGAGTVNTSGTTVTWASGDTFPPGTWWTDEKITINGVDYIVASVTDSTHLELTASAGTQTGVAYTLAEHVVADHTFICGSGISNQVWELEAEMWVAWDGGASTHPRHDVMRGVSRIAADGAAFPSTVCRDALGDFRTNLRYPRELRVRWTWGTGSVLNTATMSTFVGEIDGAFRSCVNAKRGTVNTSGTAVTWASGDKFVTGTSWQREYILIAGLPYKIVSVTDDQHLVVDTPAPTLAGAAYVQKS